MMRDIRLFSGADIAACHRRAPGMNTRRCGYCQRFFINTFRRQLAVNAPSLNNASGLIKQQRCGRITTQNATAAMPEHALQQTTGALCCAA